MLNVGGGEILVILLVALLVLGPDKLPDAARNAGKLMRQVKQLSSGFQQEIRQALDDDPSSQRPTNVPGTSAGPALAPFDETGDMSAAAAEAAAAGEVPAPGKSDAPTTNEGHRLTIDEMAERASEQPRDEPLPDVSFDGPGGSFS